MHCPKCQFENRDGVKFCEECGAKMELICPGCGSKITTGKKFCGECGQQLSLFATATKPSPPSLSLDETLAKVQRYLPQGLAEKILSQRERIEGERKQVTVMFLDMAGYTPMAEKLDPEEAYSLMDKVG